MSDGPKNTGNTEPHDDLLFAEDSNISEEDRQEILEQIDHVVDTNRIPVTKDLFRLKAKRGGALFPVLMNVILLGLAAAGILFAFRYFAVRQDSLSESARQYLSTEGRLIEEIREESETALRQKEQEIGRIQQELGELDRQSRELRQSMDERIQSREAELRARLQEELEQERARLQEQGISQEDISERLETLETQRAAEVAQQLEAFREEAQAEIRQKEQELAEAKSLAEEILQQASAEREQLRQEALQRERELRTQFEAEREVLESRSTEAETRLKEISELREREALVNDQITGAYASAIGQMRQGNVETALRELNSLEEFLGAPSIRTLPSVADRRQVELFIIENLKENLETKSVQPEERDSSLLEAANQAVNAREIAARAEQARNEGRLDDAKRLYSRALESIPALNRAYSGLRAIENNQTAGEIQSSIEAARALLEEGSREESLAEFKRAALMSAGSRSGLAEEAVNGMETILRRELAAAADEMESAVGAREDRITELGATLTQSRRRIAALTEDLEESEEELAELKSVLNERQTELDGADAAEIRERDRKIAELNGEIEELRESVQLARASGGAPSRSAVETAREDVYSGVLDYLDYVSGTDSETVKRQVRAKAEEDVQFRSVAERLQEILESGAEEARYLEFTETKLIGTVSSVTGGRVVIEPLAAVSAAQGNTIIIKRRTSSGEIPIATGEIYDAAAGRITAGLDTRLSSGRSPMVMDLVYMDMSE